MRSILGTQVRERVLTWEDRAACKDAPSRLFITDGDDDDEPSYPPPDARAFCERCVVKPECYQHAIDFNEVGVWGNTTSYQRRQLSREKERAKCPGCGSTDLFTENGIELCLSCGISWRMF
jgi:hypothetical protein